MPATYSPRHTPNEIDRNERWDNRDPGFGGRPPLKNRPTGGGGDGDNGDDGPRGRHPRERLHHYRVGLSFLLTCDLVFFLALVSAFFVRQTGGHFDAHDNYIADAHPFPVPVILWLGTLFLCLSSLCMERARRHLFYEIDVIEEWLGLGRPMARRTWPWLLATSLLGVGYLGCIGIAWRHVSQGGAHFMSSPDGAFFFVLTASHALHMVAALGMLAVAAVGLYRLRRVELRQILADCVAWFWHAMTGFWLLLLSLLLLTR
ncbi:cytochrome c oxidase subunit 3 [Acidipila sp. EB88]|uniref:cytochrome c oxidase subunit 3 n=1 Tax=Acidipila sp. EB88 TaxID=2305226 RepID=UPI000F5DE9E0|nr:cytochrome c oxidase subunit 3 [Acidipila sp. EB88]RRA49822.1 heme-copper oxidase subunit III [Acidipila sp. EB88]